jgi:hypothetical protein
MPYFGVFALFLFFTLCPEQNSKIIRDISYCIRIMSQKKFNKQRTETPKLGKA